MQFDIDHDEDGSRLLISPEDENIAEAYVWTERKLWDGSTKWEMVIGDMESCRVKLDPNEARDLVNKVNEGFNETWLMMAQAMADVKAGRGPNGEPAGTWEPDERGDYERYILSPSIEQRIDNADIARKAAKEGGP